VISGPIAIATLVTVGLGCTRPSALARALDVGDEASALGAAEASNRELDAILDRASTALAGLEGEAAIERLNRLVFDELGFEREVQQKNVELMLAPQVAANRRGSCLGLAALYLLIGERVGLPLVGVLVPGHFFVRFESAGAVRNIELLRSGEAMPEAWYVERWSVPSDRRGRAYLRSLDVDETAAVMRYNLGLAFAERGQIERAQSEYERATALFPDLAEAHASLGRTYQEAKQYALAERAYQRALAANPCLPGLDPNLASLYASIGDPKNEALHRRRATESAARCR
jgi:regulator of sirC expression with transglutaminase-like and TPR domain